MTNLRLKLSEVRSNIARSNLGNNISTRDNFPFTRRIFLSELRMKLKTPILNMFRSPTIRTNMSITKTRTKCGNKGHLIRDLKGIRSRSRSTILKAIYLEI